MSEFKGLDWAIGTSCGHTVHEKDCYDCRNRELALREFESLRASLAEKERQLLASQKAIKVLRDAGGALGVGGLSAIAGRVKEFCPSGFVEAINHHLSQWQKALSQTSDPTKLLEEAEASAIQELKARNEKLVEVLEKIRDSAGNPMITTSEGHSECVHRANNSLSLSKSKTSVVREIEARVWDEAMSLQCVWCKQGNSPKRNRNKVWVHRKGADSRICQCQDFREKAEAARKGKEDGGLLPILRSLHPPD